MTRTYRRGEKRVWSNPTYKCKTCHHDIQHNDTQWNRLNCNTHHNDTWNKALNINMLSNAFSYCYSECRYAECHYAECHYAENHYAHSRYAKRLYANCRYTKCCFAECHGT
jgi:hypothetical protein